jgi:uncharacterized protein YciI
MKNLRGKRMALFAISYIDKPDSLALRMANRQAHLDYGHSGKAPAQVKLGGPYLDDKGEMAGSLLIVECADHATAIAFTENDPYVRCGLMASVEVRPFRITMSDLS